MVGERSHRPFDASDGLELFLGSAQLCLECLALQRKVFLSLRHMEQRAPSGSRRQSAGCEKEEIPRPRKRPHRFKLAFQLLRLQVFFFAKFFQSRATSHAFFASFDGLRSLRLDPSLERLDFFPHFFPLFFKELKLLLQLRLNSRRAIDGLFLFLLKTLRRGTGCFGIRAQLQEL